MPAVSDGNRTVSDWPGIHCGRREPVGSDSETERTWSLSSTTALTTSGRKPVHAGGGLVAPVSPVLPVDVPAACSARLRNDVCHPGLRAGIRSARSRASVG